MEAAAEKSWSATVLDLQAWTYYNLYQTTSWENLLSDQHVPHEQWALDRHFWCLFCLCLWVSVILPTCLLYPQQKRDYSALHPQAWTCICIYIYIQAMPIGTYWVQFPGFPKIIYYNMVSVYVKQSFCKPWTLKEKKKKLCTWSKICAFARGSWMELIVL